MNVSELKTRIAYSDFVSIVFYRFVDSIQALCGSDFRKQSDKALKKYMAEEELRDRRRVRHIRWDMKKSYLQCKSLPDEYFLLNLMDKPASFRRQFITDRYSCMKVTFAEGRRLWKEELCSKWNLFRTCGQYFKREAIYVSGKKDHDSFLDLALKVNKLILKPDGASKGKGIEVCDIYSEKDAAAVFSKLADSGISWMVEERIGQDERMAIWNPTSVNTVRLRTFYTKEGYHMMTPTMRTGRLGSFIDNAGGGGIMANVNPETGVVCSEGFDKTGKRYTVHPDSDLKFEGFQIPEWKELLELCHEIHTECMPKHIYVGWDFALSDKGWVLIEGNLGQFGCQMIDRKGRREEYDKYLSEGARKD